MLVAVAYRHLARNDAIAPRTDRTRSTPLTAIKTVPLSVMKLARPGMQAM